jgi:hypothetical protein
MGGFSVYCIVCRAPGASSCIDVTVPREIRELEDDEKSDQYIEETKEEIGLMQFAR